MSLTGRRAAGAVCNGPPGLRPEYFVWYYGAFVLDPEGRNIEAVCCKPKLLGEPAYFRTLVLAVTGLAAGVGAWWAGYLGF